MAKFAKRHYEQTALTLQMSHPGTGLSNDNRAVVQWVSTVETFAIMFAADNPLFKRDRFLLACVPGHNVRART